VLGVAPLDHPADHVQLALEGVPVARELAGRAHEHLADDRLDGRGARARDRAVDRDVPPPEQRLALGRDRALDEPLELAAPPLVGRQEERADAVRPMLRQREVDARAQELVGRLEQDARAVARVDLGAARASVLEPVEDVERLDHRRVRGLVREVGDRADAARVVLESRVVEASGPGWKRSGHGSFGGRRTPPEWGRRTNGTYAAPRRR